MDLSKIKDRLASDRSRNSDPRTRAKPGTAAENAVRQVNTQKPTSDPTSLPALRKKLQKSQQELAAQLQLNQAEISKMERRTDMYVSTLRNYVEALGGKLELSAQFPGMDPVRISQFDPVTEHGAAMSAAQATGDHMPCPNCSQSIRKQAILCRYCKHGISPEHFKECSSCHQKIRQAARICRFCNFDFDLETP